jgi:hypothetical protein
MSGFDRNFPRSVARLARLSAAVVLGLSGWAVQAELGEQGPGSGNGGPESTRVYYTFPGRPTVSVSLHGNIVRFEGPTGYDHLGGGTVGEGYVLCYNGRRAWDVGNSESGFGSTTAYCSGNACSFTRNTTDGLLQLTQVISKNEIERAVNVEMTVTRLSGNGLYGVVLRRQADFDVDAAGALGSGQYESWFGASERESVFAWNPTNATANEGHGITLRQIVRRPGTVPYQAKVTSQILDTSCSPGNLGADRPVFGDYGASLQYNVGNIGQGGSFYGRVQYQRN